MAGKRPFPLDSRCIFSRGLTFRFVRGGGRLLDRDALTMDHLVPIVILRRFGSLKRCVCCQRSRQKRDFLQRRPQVQEGGDELIQHCRFGAARCLEFAVIEGLKPGEELLYRTMVCDRYDVPSLVKVDWQVMRAGFCGVCGSESLRLVAGLEPGGVLVSFKPFQIFVGVGCRYLDLFLHPLHQLSFAKVVVRSVRWELYVADVIEFAIERKVAFEEVCNAMPRDVAPGSVGKLWEAFVRRREDPHYAAKLVNFRWGYPWNPSAPRPVWYGPPPWRKDYCELPRYIDPDRRGRSDELDRCDLVRAALGMPRGVLVHVVKERTSDNAGLKDFVKAVRRRM
jgi:hypothetical protein